MPILATELAELDPRCTEPLEGISSIGVMPGLFGLGQIGGVGLRFLAPALSLNGASPFSRR
jgi:hypothetical protein